MYCYKEDIKIIKIKDDNYQVIEYTTKQELYNLKSKISKRNR